MDLTREELEAVLQWAAVADARGSLRGPALDLAQRIARSLGCEFVAETELPLDL